MNKSLLFAVLLLAETAAAQTNIPDIVIGGVEYHNVRWTRWTPSTVSFIHSTGGATVSLTNLPPELQKQFGYNPTNAVAYEITNAKQRSEAAEKSRQKSAAEQLAAKHKSMSVPFSGTVDEVVRGGLIVKIQDAGTRMTYSSPTYNNQVSGGRINPRRIIGTEDVDARYSFLAGYPHNVAVDGRVSCQAYPDGQIEIGGEQFSRWIYEGE